MNQEKTLMFDIHMCDGVGCPQGGRCYRVVATPNPTGPAQRWKDYSDRRGVGARCNYYLPLDPRERGRLPSAAYKAYRAAVDSRQPFAAQMALADAAWDAPKTDDDPQSSRAALRAALNWEG